MFGNYGEEKRGFLKTDFPKASEITVVTYAPGYLIAQGNGIAGVCNYSNNKELALKALTAVYSQEDLSNILLYGVEGVDSELIDEINSIISEYDGLFDGEISNVEDAIQELNSRLEDADFQSLFDEIEQRYISAGE